MVTKNIACRELQHSHFIVFRDFFVDFVVVLKVAPAETEAFHYQIVCMIQLSQFQKALEKIHSFKDAR